MSSPLLLRTVTGAENVDKILKNFFFPQQINNLKRITSKNISKGKEVYYTGSLKIHNNFYRVYLKYLLTDKYIHIIFIFFIPSQEKTAKKLFQSVKINPNFIPF